MPPCLCQRDMGAYRILFYAAFQQAYGVEQIKCAFPG